MEINKQRCRKTYYQRQIISWTKKHQELGLKSTRIKEPTEFTSMQNKYADRDRKRKYLFNKNLLKNVLVASLIQIN